MANSTPSSVLNDLAKSSGVETNYELVSEQGPHHERVFTVHLRIGGHGPFEGIGSSIKNARNMAASNGLAASPADLNLNPTVELNLLSMKSGEQVVYTEIANQVLSCSNNNPHISSFGNKNRWKVMVSVCGTNFIGEGKTKSAARGNAASKALVKVKSLLLEKANTLEINQSTNEVNVQPADSSTVKSTSSVAELYEKANLCKSQILFEVVHETGPPHLKSFRIKCVFGTSETFGEGVGKKTAKNQAAQLMLEMLKNKPLIAPEQKGNVTRKNKPGKKKNIDSGIDVNLDPVTYLTQLMQLRKEQAALYTLKNDLGLQKDGVMRFQIEAAIEGFKAVGYGESKRAAKSNSALNLLKSLGIDLDELRQMKQMKGLSIKNSLLSCENNPSTVNRTHGSCMASRTPVRIMTRPKQEPKAFDSSKQKLEYIAQKNGFQVLYNDFVKSETAAQYSTQLAVFTTPPELYQSVGDSVEASREKAAEKALANISNREGCVTSVS